MRIINKQIPINCLSSTCMKISIREKRFCEQILIATSMCSHIMLVKQCEFKSRRFTGRLM